MINNIDELFLYISNYDIHHSYDRNTIKSIWRKAGSLGVFSCQEDGYSKFLLEKLCQYDIYDYPFWLQREVILYLIKRYGTDGQKSKYISGLESGSIIASIALTEETGGSDLKNILSFYDDKKSVLSGKKRFITNAAFADIILYSAKNQDGKIGLWILDVDDRISIRRINCIPEIAALGFSEIELNDFLVDRNMLLGGFDNCLIYIMKALSFERYCCAYMSFHLGKKLCSQNLNWLKNKGDLWNKQILQYKMAEFISMNSLLDSHFEMLYKKFEKKGNIFTEAAMLKYMSVKNALEITQFSSLLRAGEFVSLEIDPYINKMYNTIISLSAAGGTQEIMLNIISESLKI